MWPFVSGFFVPQRHIFSAHQVVVLMLVPHSFFPCDRVNTVSLWPIKSITWTILSVQFNSLKSIQVAVQPPPPFIYRALSSSHLKLSPLDGSSLSSPPSGNSSSTSCLYGFDYCRNVVLVASYLILWLASFTWCHGLRGHLIVCARIVRLFRGKQHCVDRPHFVWMFLGHGGFGVGLLLVEKWAG